MQPEASLENNTAAPSPPSVVALVTDLIFATKITSTAASLGAGVVICRKLESLLEKVVALHPRAVFIDLNASLPDPIEAIRALRKLDAPPRIIAYLSHVQADLAKAARDAGADEVLARSAFSAGLPDLLRRYA